jgi:16S rRNA (cytosine1402-N4)-methyltransferase
MSANFKHIPVLAKESIELLNVRTNKVYVDCTLGGGGHSENLKLQNQNIKIIAIDQDQDAINAAEKRLARFKGIEFIHDNFRKIKSILKEPVDGFLFDLGVSSYQIDEASRGFSIQKDGPLDMRMDKSQKLTAEYIINNFDEEELVEIFQNFGEERFSKRIARRIAEKRPVKTTQDLRNIIEKAIPTWKKRESATRIFQALRIAVNNELDSLKTALQDAIDLLKPGGRIVVISYHSLEDRIVKQTLRQAKADGKLDLLTKKPLRAKDNEIASNPRAKSAKLRAGEKLG